MKKIILILSLSLIFVANARVKINSVELDQQNDNLGKIVVSVSGLVKNNPEVTIKDSLLQIVIPDSVVWPKIEKKVSVNGEDFDTTLMAYQFNKDSVRVRAVLPYSLSGKEKLVSVSLKDGLVELIFPKQNAGNPKVAPAVTKNVGRKPGVDKLDESYLEKLMNEKEEKAPQAIESNVASNVLKNTDQKEVAEIKTAEDKIKTSMSSVKKSSGDAFSITGYIGKFAAFLGLVLLLFYGAVNVLKKGILKKSKLAIFQNMKAIEVLNTTYIGPKKNLMMVKAHNQVFLIGTSEAGIQFLSEIKDVTGLIKNGEKEEVGENFDTNLDSAKIADKEMQLKETYTPAQGAEREDKGALDNFLANASTTQVKDQVKFSDQIKNKIKRMRPLQ